MRLAQLGGGGQPWTRRWRGSGRRCRALGGRGEQRRALLGHGRGVNNIEGESHCCGGGEATHTIGCRGKVVHARCSGSRAKKRAPWRIWAHEQRRGWI
jgi:hypothetical protein